MESRGESAPPRGGIVGHGPGSSREDEVAPGVRAANQDRYVHLSKLVDAPRPEQPRTMKLKPCKSFDLGLVFNGWQKFLGTL